jgi:hypothetical protein
MGSSSERDPASLHSQNSQGVSPRWGMFPATAHLGWMLESSLQAGDLQGWALRLRLDPLAHCSRLPFGLGHAASLWIMDVILTQRVP